ncbi:hypothetical protein D9M72_540440 [compost metagenome]
MRRKLHAPGRPLRLVDHVDLAQLPRACKRHAAFKKILALVERQIECLGWIVAPVLDAMGGDCQHIVARLGGQPIHFEEPLKPIFAGIVGGRRKTQIAVARLQLTEILGRFPQGGNNVETVGKTAHFRRARHELRNSFCPFRADSIRPEQAFTPDQAGEEGRGQVVHRRVMVDHATNIAGEVLLADAERLRGIDDRPP